MPISNTFDLETDLSTELVPQDDPRSKIISIDLGRHSGDPCFTGTRVPIQDLWDYLSGDGNLADFLEDFPTVKRSQVHEAIRMASEKLLEGLIAG